MMNSNRKKQKTAAWIGSVAGILIVAAILITLNAILKPLNWRWDCTEDKRYTLSRGSENILKHLDKVVSLRFYYSRDAADMPVFLKNYASRVEDLLGEFKRAGGDKIDLRQLNPTPDSDEEDSAVLDGVSGRPLDMFGSGDPIYFGVAVSCGGRTAVLPFLSPENEAQLEYDLARAITEVTAERKVKLGILSSLPVMGGYSAPPMMMNSAPNPPWWIVTELKRNYDVVEIPVSGTEIASDIDVILALQPQNLSDGMLFALDQFILRGGKVLAFLDPFAVSGMRQQPYPQPGGSSFDKLLKAWGIEFNSGKIVADRKLATRLRGPYGNVESMPTVLTLGKAEMDTAIPALSALNTLLLFCPGEFSGTPVEGLTQTVLLHSSDDAGLVESFEAQGSGEQILKNLKPENREFALALQLAGTFPTAFPDGSPEPPAAGDGKEKKAEQSSQKKADSLKKSTQPGAVVLVGDADMLFDSFCVRQGNFLGQTVAQPINDNLSFALNLVDQLSGDENLFEIRARGASSRPFTVVRDLQAKAEKEFQGKIVQLEEELRTVQMQIDELQRKRKPGEKELLSSEQRKVLADFRRKEVEARKELKQVRRQLRREIDSLENTLIFINIALMPILVVAAGITVAAVKRRRSAHR